MAIEKEIKTRIVHKHDTETNWNKATGFVPKAAELIVYDKDANHPWVRFKIGDGQTSVVNLPFMYDGKPSVTAFGIVSATLPRYPSAADTAKYAQIARQNTLAFQQNIVAKRTAAGEYPSYPIFRELYFPGGTYPFDDTITISENCGIELSQDTILHFLQTNKNCIEMDRSASIDGHHGLIKVNQDFKASVISVDTSLDNAGHTVPPYYKADPMWKSARMIKDVHIVKMHTSGFCAPCNTVNKSYTTAAGKAEMAAQIGGIGLHMKTTYNGGDIWTANISGMRIAGAFSYGINVENIDNTESGYGDSKDPAWNHDMRLEATILSAEVGIRVFNCNPAHLNLTIEPGSSIDIYNDSYTEVVAAGVPYSKNGIVLEHCTNIDLGSTIVWDWDEEKTLYNPNTEEGRKNSHLAIYGACPGLILSDLLYSEKGASVLDVRQLIYTDTPKNLKTMSILQESVMRWFSPAKENILDGSGQVIGEKIVPNFNVTDEEVYRLVTEEDLAEIVEENQQIPTFTNYAKDNYLVGSRLVGSTGGLDNSAGYGEYYLTIDFIPFTQDTTLYFENFYIPTNTVETGQCVINFYDANKNAIYEGNYTLGQSFSWKVGNDPRWYLNLDYEALENNVWSIKTLSLPSNKKNTGKWPQVAYLRVCSGKSVNKNPETIIVTDSPIEYVTVGKLAEGITISQSQIRDLNIEDTGATSVEITGPGNAVTAATYDADTRKITLTKGSTFNNYEHPKGNAPSKISGLYKFSTDASSHINAVTAVTKSDITALGIPGSDTTYSAGTGLALNGTTINHTNTVTAKNSKNQETAAPGYGGTFKVTEPLYDTTGHITGINTATITMPAAQTIPTELKNPNALIINGTTYDGSKEITFDAMPLGGTLLNQTFVVSALSDKKTHRTIMSLGEQNAFLFKVTNLETEAQQFFTINEQGSYLTNLRVDEPVNDNNAATKKYVDDKIGAIENGLY